jgi:hypothetical protein
MIYFETSHAFLHYASLENWHSRVIPNPSAEHITSLLIILYALHIDHNHLLEINIRL